MWGKNGLAEKACELNLNICVGRRGLLQRSTQIYGKKSPRRKAGWGKSTI